tara:strand:- start:1686 stop:2225 length:540 start_codon:yes stop_codon:yes gene_type:complete
MVVETTKLNGVLRLKPKVFSDQRGFFLETFQKKRYEEIGVGMEFVQDNHSRSRKGTLRGIHFQTENPQGKLVRCVRGRIFDVVVDIVEGSPSFGAWEGFELTGENMEQIWIPPGYAHGFLVLSNEADFEYKCTDYYNPSAEACLIWNDPDVAIEWPIESPPILTNRDKEGLRLKELGKQ